MPKREFRYIPAKELRVATTATGRTLSGYAAVFNSLSEDLGGFREKLDPACFDACLASNPDIRFLQDHESSRILGRTKSGTLRVTTDEFGLKFECDLPDTSVARDLTASIDRGDVDACSFGFFTDLDEWLQDSAQVTTRTIKAATVFDCSAVTYPAYTATSVSVRSLFPDGLIEQRRAMPDPNESGCSCSCPACAADTCDQCSEPDCADTECQCAQRSKPLSDADQETVRLRVKLASL